jgi:antirestriction protein ArdC
VSVEAIENGALGYYMPREHRIVVKEGMSVARMAHVLAHEVGHSMLHKGDEEADGRNPAHLSRGSKELEAESVSFILCNAFGIDPGTSSFGYIADWSGKETQKELRLSAERIAKTSKEILEALGVESEES